MNKISFISIGVLLLSIVIFFQPFLFSGRLPIPSDTIIGLYHPFRDLYAKEYPNGIPYKNFLITDPVRQQYPWRYLSVESIQVLTLPLWNPYNFAGSPLLANIQAASLYPGNIIFFFLPFAYAWSILIVLQPLLAGLFLFLYLRNLRISPEGSILGAVAFAFSGFFVAWLEWGTILHVALWLPLLLLSIDKLLVTTNKKHLTFWSTVFCFSLCSSFFAGHLQTFFYLYTFVFVYFVSRWFYSRNNKQLLLFIGLTIVFIIVTFIQWYPTLQLLLQSARDIDQAEWTKVGWFIPWQHAIQFIVPDFFGNPATLNYWSDWNYAEFIGYIGLIPFTMAIYALFFRHDKKTLFYGVILFVSLFFAFPTFIAKIPYIISLPFVSTAQPTRLLFLIDFCLAVLAAFGLDYFLKHSKKIIYPLGVVLCFFILLWAFIFVGFRYFPQVSLENIAIAKRNLLFPSILFGISIVLYMIAIFVREKKIVTIVASLLIIVTLFDLIRFGTKFTPFTNPAYLYPSTATIHFLQSQKGQFRLMSTDSRAFPPNFSAMYGLQSIEGYDPIYVRRYAELIAASERKKADIAPPFGFNRIITPHNYNSPIINLLNVKYIISLSHISSPTIEKVFTEGETRIYENKNVLPRAFFVESVQVEPKKEKLIAALINPDVDLRKVAFIEDKKMLNGKTQYSQGKATIISYKPNKVVIKTDNNNEGFLVLSDIFYPIWKAEITDKSNKVTSLEVVRTNYIFRGVVVPPGKHTVVFYTSLFN